MLFFNQAIERKLNMELLSVIARSCSCVDAFATATKKLRPCLNSVSFLDGATRP